LLDVNSIDVYYGDLQALWNVSMTVEEGEIVAIIGSNGAGKSTLVNTVAGLLSPATGGVIFKGVHIDRAPVHRVVEFGASLVVEDRGIFPGMSVLENLELGAFTRKSRRLRNDMFKSVYELFPILDARKKQVAGTLSGGEQQMLAIGRALMGKPELLMLDEPSLGLAPLVVKRIFEIIKQINESGVSILLVEQNVRAALRLARRAYIVENGRITREGDAVSLLEDGHVRSAYLGTG
jgi:branched-chain amino acid transport system ATP-binding protein